MTYTMLGGTLDSTHSLSHSKIDLHSYKKISRPWIFIYFYLYIIYCKCGN